MVMGAGTKKMPCAKTDALRMIFSHMGLWQQGKIDTFCLKEDFDISTARVFLCWEIGFEC